MVKSVRSINEYIGILAAQMASSSSAITEKPTSLQRIQCTGCGSSSWDDVMLLMFFSIGIASEALYIEQ